MRLDPWARRPSWMSRRESAAKRQRRSAMYVLEPVPGEPGVLATLNRRYRPCGQADPKAPGGPLAAEPFNRVAAADLDLRVCRKVTDADGSVRYYLFDNATAPWLSKRLAQEHEQRLVWLWKLAPVAPAELARHAFQRNPRPRPRLRLLAGGAT